MTTDPLFRRVSPAHEFLIDRAPWLRVDIFRRGTSGHFHPVLVLTDPAPDETAARHEATQLGRWIYEVFTNDPELDRYQLGAIHHGYGVEQVTTDELHRRIRDIELTRELDAIHRELHRRGHRA